MRIKRANQTSVFSLTIFDSYYMKIRAQRLVSSWKTIGDAWHGATCAGPCCGFMMPCHCRNVVWLYCLGGFQHFRQMALLSAPTFFSLPGFPSFVSPFFPPSFYSLKYAYWLLRPPADNFCCDIWTLLCLLPAAEAKGRKPADTCEFSGGAFQDVHTGSRKMVDSISFFLAFAYCN